MLLHKLWGLMYVRCRKLKRYRKYRKQILISIENNKGIFPVKSRNNKLTLIIAVAVNFIIF